jgi:hypothetical protein
MKIWLEFIFLGYPSVAAREEQTTTVAMAFFVTEGAKMTVGAILGLSDD